MKKYILYFIVLIVSSCASDDKQMKVEGTIKGLKKGTIYLRKANDTSVVVVDSFKVGKDSKFKLSSEIDAPEAFYLELEPTATDKNNRITFFGYKGLTTVNASLKNFGYNAQIKGSKEQELLEEYITMIGKFQDQNLYLFKQNYDAKINNDELAYLASLKKINNQKKRRYLYTVNFALANKNSIVAPFIALTEISDAKLNLLDTINSSLSKEVKLSKYGKALNSHIEKNKAL